MRSSSNTKPFRNFKNPVEQHSQGLFILSAPDYLRVLATENLYQHNDTRTKRTICGGKGFVALPAQSGSVQLPE